MHERIKKLRKTLDLTQREFGDRIGVKPNTIATYEIGRNQPIDAVISLICREFNVSETWLRTGEGEMFDQREENAVERLCAELHASELEAEIIRAYFKIDARIREPFMRQLLEQVHTAPAAGKDIPVPPTLERTEADIAALEREADAAAAEYRRRWLLEKKAADASLTLSDFSDGAKMA